MLRAWNRQAVLSKPSILSNCSGSMLGRFSAVMRSAHATWRCRKGFARSYRDRLNREMDESIYGTVCESRFMPGYSKELQHLGNTGARWSLIVDL